MELTVKCKECRFKIVIKGAFSDRAEIAKEKGKVIKLKCEDCSKENSYSVNDIRARESKFVSTITFIIFGIGTSIVGFLLRDYLFSPKNPYNALGIAGILLLPVIAYTIITRQDRDNVKRFNSYKT